MRPIISIAVGFAAGLTLSAPIWAQTPLQPPVNVIVVPPGLSNPLLRQRIGSLSDEPERLRLSEDERRRVEDRRADPAEELSRRIEFRGDPTPAPPEPLPSGTRPLSDIIVRPQ
jgi:hypothetical protein